MPFKSDPSTSPCSGPGAATPATGTSPPCVCNRAEITLPSGSLTGPVPVPSWQSASCYHFDFQGVVSGSPGAYVLDLLGTIDPSPPYGYKWEMEAAAGTLAPDNIASPTHTAPASPGEGNVKLTGIRNGQLAGCTDQKRVKIYEDHLARDRDNFGVGISCDGSWTFTKYGTPITMPSDWNCFGSVDHAYNGSGGGYVSSVGIPTGWAQTTYDAPVDAATWATIESSLRRGDVVSFWSGSALGGFDAQHAHTSLGGSTMYGANNEPVIRPTGHPATWKWFETISQTYFNNVNANPRTAGLLTRVIVHRKP